MQSINIMKKHHLWLAIATLGLTLMFNAVPASADPHVFETSGVTPADIQPTVNAFRAHLGHNNGIGGTFIGGRREINWDGVPDQFAAPNLMPANFFNSNSPRGVVFFTPGTGFQVSANSINPTNTPVRFGNIRANFPNIFSTFSPQRLFTALDSNITEALFFIPGTTQPARVRGFGVVFTDVNNDSSTTIEYLDVNGNLLLSRDVLPGPNVRGSLSFLGVIFDSPDVFLVRITSGNTILKTPAAVTSNDSATADLTVTQDVVVMDDFVYGEPRVLQ
jgi:hypothetical protein